MEQTFDNAKACIAQNEYCDRTGKPHFAPYSGICYACGQNIYQKGGISVEEASGRLITGCPFCRRSYCE